MSGGNDFFMTGVRGRPSKKIGDRNPKIGQRVFVATVGTPAVLTETLYGLCFDEKGALRIESWKPDHIYMVTTKKIATILIEKFCTVDNNPIASIYDGTNKLAGRFPQLHIILANKHTGAVHKIDWKWEEPAPKVEGEFIENITTKDDAVNMNDCIRQVIKKLCDEKLALQLRVSLAGGRKTMTTDIITAVQTFGRSKYVKMYHTLVPESVEFQAEEFWHPRHNPDVALKQRPRFGRKEQKPLNLKNASGVDIYPGDITVMNIPVTLILLTSHVHAGPLKPLYSRTTRELDAGFSQVILEDFENKPKLEFVGGTKIKLLGKGETSLPSNAFAYLAALAGHRKDHAEFLNPKAAPIEFAIRVLQLLNAVPTGDSDDEAENEKGGGSKRKNSVKFLLEYRTMMTVIAKHDPKLDQEFTSCKNNGGGDSWAAAYFKSIIPQSNDIVNRTINGVDIEHLARNDMLGLSNSATPIYVLMNSKNYKKPFAKDTEKDLVDTVDKYENEVIDEVKLRFGKAKSYDELIVSLKNVAAEKLGIWLQKDIFNQGNKKLSDLLSLDGIGLLIEEQTNGEKSFRLKLEPRHVIFSENYESVFQVRPNNHHASIPKPASTS